MSGSFPIIDAHHHVWDPDVNYHPWLRDKPVSGFRYGDYSKINCPYLVADYLADSRNWPLVGSVYIEAEWDPADPIGEMNYIARVRRDNGYPSVAVGQAWLDRADVAEVLERLSGFDFVRSVRHKPRANANPAGRAAGGMTDGRWREGFALLRDRGLRFDLQTPWWHLHEAADLAVISPIRRSSSITQDCRQIAAPRASRAGVTAWRSSPNCRMSPLKFQGLAFRGGHGRWTTIGTSP
jgi:predicted TIM-barrel fold metal-dependent hydrolase